MKITIVGQYYWPDSFTINEIAEDLAAMGHQVKVLTGLPDYASSVVPEEYKYGKNRHEMRNGVEIFRVPIIARHSGIIYRVLNYISFFLSSSLFALTHKKELECDVVMAYQTAPVLMGNAAIILKKCLKKKLFFYCMDIWPDQMKVWNVYEGNPLFKIMTRYCQYAYGSADILGVSSRPFTEYMINVNKVEKSKIVYLPNHYNTIPADNVGKTEKNTQDVVNIAYAGNIGQQQNFECMLKAVSMMKTTKPFKIHIYGEGVSFESCKELCSQLGLKEKVCFYGRVSKETLNDIYPLMDAFILTLCSEEQIGYVANTVPSRLQGYMAAGKPIIASIDGGAREIINESHCGLAVKANDASIFADALDEFVNNFSKYQDYGKNAIDYFNKNFERKVVMKRIEEYLYSLCN